MPGVALNETVNCDNPLLQFFYQTSGILTDVAVLAFVIRDVTNDAERVASTPVTLTDCSAGGSKLGTGRYAPVFTADSGAGWVIGTHEVIWTYQVTLTSVAKTWRQRFEVLDAALFSSGAGYRGYVDSTDLFGNAAVGGAGIGSIQQAADLVGETIEGLTGRIFDPRYISALYNATFSGALPMQNPIVGISKITVVGSNPPTDELVDIDLAGIRVYNRHLQGMNDFDDRDNPRLEFTTAQTPGEVTIQSSFTWGRQNTLIEGVFAYTEFDGTPVGRRPARLGKVAGILTVRQIQDPFGVDVFVSQPGRIREAKTRDQQIKFGGASDGAVGPLTGDRIVDDILIQFMRPPHFGAVPSIGEVSDRRDRTVARGNF